MKIGANKGVRNRLLTDENNNQTFYEHDAFDYLTKETDALG